MKPASRNCCDEKRQDISPATDRLRSRDHKITGPRRAILEVLGKHRHPMTNKEILAALPSAQCDLATVYRSMHLLQKMGLVQKFDFGDGTARFELVLDTAHGHHHHLVCTNCAKVVEIEECFPEALEQKIATQNGFQAVSHRLEFFGICPECHL
jgi:Fur family ferric uptake transcriptional regulator